MAVEALSMAVAEGQSGGKLLILGRQEAEGEEVTSDKLCHKAHPTDPLPPTRAHLLIAIQL